MARGVVREVRRAGKARMDVLIPLEIKEKLAREAFEQQVSISVLAEELLREAMAARGWIADGERLAPKPSATGGAQEAATDALTVAQVARELGLSRQRVYDYLEDGRLRAVRDDRARLRIPVSEFERFKRERG